MILVPRKKLAAEFVTFAEANRGGAGIPKGVRISAIVRQDLDREAKKHLLVLALLVSPDSVLRRRTLAGIEDDVWFSGEFAQLKVRYGSLERALKEALAEDFPKKSRRLRDLCAAIRGIDVQLQVYEGKSPQEVIDALFPPEGDGSLKILSQMLSPLTSDSDSLGDRYRKLLDSLRTLPSDPDTIRAMTLIASKGLDADHVYILGCNAGNLPGERRSAHLTDDEYRSEQRRLLYVGMTRAKKSLTVSWGRQISFRQSRSQHTGAVATRRGSAGAQSILTMSPFLQDLAGVVWERRDS
jgi:superfamily I DNA/RNA helicase